MKYVGLTFMVLGGALWLAALGFQEALGIERSTVVWFLAIPAMLLGLIAWAVSASISISRGEVKLRPWQALKPAIVIFVILMAAKLLASEVFSVPMRSWVISILGTAIFAIVLGLYQTVEDRTA